MTPSDRIILALDLPGERKALEWAERLSGRVGMFKVGLRLFTACGPPLVSRIVLEHGPVFLDLKYHDIPNTVAAAVREAAGLGVSMLTVHASGGLAMLRAAAEAASEAARAGVPDGGSAPGTRVRVLAVTVLTSLGSDDLAATGIVRSMADQVSSLAESAWIAGCDGFVASPLDVAPLRERLGKEPLLVTPGIRLPDAPRDDQARTATPREALEAGADYLVIGRPILQAAAPDDVLQKIVRSIT